MSNRKLSRLSTILLAISVIPFFCGGFARTAHQYGGPLWLDLFADIMLGLTLCGISGFGISRTLDETNKFKVTLGNILSDAIWILALVLGLAIAISRTIQLLG